MDATHHVEPARPQRDVGTLPGARVEYQSAAEVRRQIYSTLDDLHLRIGQLQEYIHSRFGSIHDPLHVRETITAQPIRACSVALLAGVACGLLRVHRLPWNFTQRALYLSGNVVRGASAVLGSKLASDLIGQALSSRWKARVE